VAWGSFEQPAGTELSHLGLCRELAGRGHEISLFFEQDGALLDEWRRFTRREVRLEGYRRDLSTPLRSSLGLVRGAAAIAASRPECVYLNFPVDAWLGRLGALPSRAPVVCHLHLAFDEASFFLRSGMATVARFVAVSEATAASWRPLVSRPEKLSVINNGVGTTRFVPPDPSQRAAARAALGLSPDAEIVLFVGRVVENKGPGVLLEALGHLHDSGRTAVHLVVAGEEKDPAFSGRLRAESARLPVSWVAWRADVGELYAAADVVAVPSTVADSFPLVPLEAMACGVPVVASAVGGLPEMLTGELAELLVAPGDAQALAAGIERALERGRDAAFRQSLRPYVEEHFSLSASGEALEAVMADAVASRAARRPPRPRRRRRPGGGNR